MCFLHCTFKGHYFDLLTRSENDNQFSNPTLAFFSKDGNDIRKRILGRVNIENLKLDEVLEEINEQERYLFHNAEEQKR